MKKKALLTLVVTALVAAGGYWFANSNFWYASQPPSVSAEEIVAAGAYNYANPDVLVDTAWVQENLDDDSVRLIEAGSNFLDYETGHLPGAVFVNMRNEFVNTESSVDGVIPTPDQLADILSERGIQNDDTIVLYDADSNLWAARAFWVLAYYQHEDIRIYNGGEIKWEEEGNDLTRAVVDYEASEYETNEPNPDVYVDSEYILENLDNENVVTCDTRRESEYVGEEVRADRGGRIPGSTHLEWVHNVQEDGTFKPAPELAAMYIAEGFTPDKEILTYCQSGVRSSHTWFVLTHLLGYPEVRNYDGSWTEWGNTDAPIS